jgi:toxin YoeB
MEDKEVKAEGSLKHGLSGYRSRRINDEHRIVYKIESDSLFVAQVRYHY